MGCIFIFFCIIFFFESVPVVKYKLPSHQLGLYEDFEFSFPGDSVESDDGSSILLSLEPNEYLTCSFRDPVLEGKYEYITKEAHLLFDGFYYFTDSEGRLYIVNVRDPTNAFLVESKIENLLTTGLDLFAMENSLFVADGNGGLIVLNITDREKPIMTFNSTNELYGRLVSATSSSCYVVDATNQIAIYDLSSNFFHPEYITQFSLTSTPYHFVEKDEFLYSAEDTNGLKIYNVSDRLSPELVGSFNTPGKAKQVRVVDNLVYVADHYGFYIVDVSDVTNPTPIGSYSRQYFSKVNDLVIKSSQGNREELAILAVSNALRIVNISNSSSPVLINSLTEDANYESCLHDTARESPNHIFCLQESSHMGILDISDPLNMAYTFRGGFVGTGKAKNIDIRDSHVLVSSESDGVHIFDVRNRKEPRFVSNNLGAYDSRTYGVNVAKDFDVHPFMYVSNFVDGLVVVNMSDVSNMQNLGKCITEEAYESVGIGNFVYVADGDNSNDHMFSICNISDPYNPTVVGWTSLNVESTMAVSVAEVGDKIFAYGASGYDGISVLDVTDPSRPYVTGRCYCREAKDVSVRYPYLFVADRQEGLKIIDVSDPTNPFEVGQLIDESFPRTIGVYVDGDMVYLAHEYDGVRSVNVRDVSNPVFVGHEPSPTLALNVISRDNYIYVADGNNGLKIIRQNLTIHSNPETWDRFCGELEVRIRVADASGELIYSFKIEREDYCSGRGKCLSNHQCVCNEGYEGDSCEKWSCYSIDYDDYGKTCGGKGKCISPEHCQCQSGYSGERCDIPIIYLQIFAPLLTISIFLFIGCGLIVCVGICVFICLCMFSFLVCLSVFSIVTVRQSEKLKRFSRLKDFDIHLQEQKLEEDTSIAHLKINEKLFHIQMDEIKMVKLLGEGGSNSKVYLATWKGRRVAFKLFKTRNICSEDTFDEFERETSVLSSVSHPFILTFYGCTLKPPRVGIVMEFCPNGDIAVFCTKYRNTHRVNYPIGEKFRWVREICDAMSYLHSLDILHRDLKPENILLDEKVSCKVMDFGLSVISRSNRIQTKRVGTSFYMAPEVFSSYKYGSYCDVFSFGILLFVLLTDKFLNPYSTKEGSSDFESKKSIEYRIANDPNFRPDVDGVLALPEYYVWAKNVMRKCWSHEPEDRMKFSELQKLFREKEVEVQKIVTQRILVSGNVNSDQNDLAEEEDDDEASSLAEEEEDSSLEEEEKDQSIIDGNLDGYSWKERLKVVMKKLGEVKKEIEGKIGVEEKVREIREENKRLLSGVNRGEGD